MFTGLVESTGTLTSLTPSATRGGPTRIVVEAPSLATRLRTGDSIAVSGVCLTALDITPTHFSADLADETVRRTKLARLQPGTTLNLELPTPAGTPLGGHIVQGHVDGIGTLLAVDPLDPNPSARLLPPTGASVSRSPSNSPVMSCPRVPLPSTAPH